MLNPELLTLEQKCALLLAALQEIKEIVKPQKRFDDPNFSWGNVNERDIDVLCDKVLEKVADSKY